MILEKILGFTPANNFRETIQVLWTTWAVKDYAILPKDFTNPIIVDIGSHIGISALYFKHRHPNAKISCFEPNPETFNLLQKNTKNLDNVELFNVAVHNFTGKSSLGVGKVAWSDSLTDKNLSLKIPVNVISVSEICRKHIDLLKIDAEGSEFAIVSDLNKSGNIANIDHIIMEWHGKINGKHHLKETLDTLKKK